MRETDNLPPYCAVVKNSRSLNFLDPSGPARPVTGELYLYYLHGIVIACEQEHSVTMKRYDENNIEMCIGTQICECELKERLCKNSY